MLCGEGNIGIPIDVDLARRPIVAQFPQWSSLPMRAVEPGGWDNRTFRLGDTMSVRLPSAEAYITQVEKEYRWQPILARHLPLPVPMPIAKDSPAEGYPWPWSVHQWIDGEPATTGHIANLTELTQSLARFLAALHDIDATGGPRRDSTISIVVAVLLSMMRKRGRQRSHQSGTVHRYGFMVIWRGAICL